MMEVLVQGVEKLGVELTPTQLQQFEIYYQEIVTWNQKFNLTSVTSYEEAQAKHFLDSLTAIPVLRELFPAKPLAEIPLQVVDIGAGAGLPGIPLKIALPQIHLILVESTGKKVTFLRHAVEALQLTDVEVALGRAEDMAHEKRLREKADLCLARAVAALPTLVELALPFVKVGGFFIAYKGPEITGELDASSNAIRTLGGKLRGVRNVQLDRILTLRNLVVISKVTKTPPIYPRRSGLPYKRPL